jgi:hypothetical protein
MRLTVLKAGRHATSRSPSGTRDPGHAIPWHRVLAPASRLTCWAASLWLSGGAGDRGLEVT